MARMRNQVPTRMRMTPPRAIRPPARSKKTVTPNEKARAKRSATGQAAGCPLPFFFSLLPSAFSLCLPVCRANKVTNNGNEQGEKKAATPAATAKSRRLTPVTAGRSKRGKARSRCTLPEPGGPHRRPTGSTVGSGFFLTYVYLASLSLFSVIVSHLIGRE
jgi:hypothetical protein